MSTETTPRLHEREPQTLVRDAAYAVTAIADEAVADVRTLIEKLEQLREDAPAKAKELRETGPDRVKNLPTEVETQLEERRAKVESQLKDVRERATKDLDERIAAFEASFDAKAAAGAERIAKLKEDERVARVSTALEPVGDQLKIARTQVKAASTALRKTLDVAVDAGKQQAEYAKRQVKAARTSTMKTVETAVDAARDIAS